MGFLCEMWMTEVAWSQDSLEEVQHLCVKTKKYKLGEVSFGNN